MKILIIGNSHAACLIDAWRNVKSKTMDFSGIHLDHFARAGEGMAEIGFDGDRIFATTAEARDFQRRLGQDVEFCLTEYDSVLIVGHELSIFRLVPIVARNHVLGWNYDNRQDLPMITRTCLTDALTDSLDGTNSIKILRMLSPVVALKGIKVTVVPQPFPSEAILENRAKAAGFLRISRAGIASHCRNIFDATVSARVTALGAIFQQQPESTVVNAVLTDRNFMLGARRLFDLDRLQPSSDVLHANSAYGSLILDKMFST